MAGCSRDCVVCGRSNFLENGSERSFECSNCKIVNSLDYPPSQAIINRYLQDKINKIKDAFK